MKGGVTSSGRGSTFALFSFALCLGSSHNLFAADFDLRISTDGLPVETLKAACARMGKVERKLQYCDDFGSGGISSYTLTQRSPAGTPGVGISAPPRTCDVQIAPSFPSSSLIFLQNVGRDWDSGWRAWIAGAFLLQGYNCQNLRAYVSIVGFGAARGWFYLGVPTPGVTYTITYSQPSVWARMPPILSFEMRVCQDGSPVNGCALGGDISVAGVASPGFVSEALQLAAYTADPSDAREESAQPAANTAGTTADDLFASALAKSPEEARREAEAARRRADEAFKTGGANPLVQQGALLIGGQLAERAGQGQLFQQMTESAPGGIASAAGGNCSQLQQQFDRDVTRASQTQGRCAVWKAQLSVYQRYKPQVAQACRGQPGYEATVREFDTQIAANQRSMSQAGCR